MPLMAERAMKETNIFPPTIFPILQRDEKCKRKYSWGQNSKQRVSKPPKKSIGKYIFIQGKHKLQQKYPN